MKEITDKELLQLQLDILRDVDSFCRENGIEYFLVGGTGIGAVRHGGYIPWDDDIDIGMIRPYYDKFLATFNGTYKNLRVYAPEIDWEYYAPYANVCDTRTLLLEGANGHRKDEIGVKIDIFPYDGVPSDEAEFEVMRKKAIKLVDACYIKRYMLSEVPNKTLRTVCSVLFRKLLQVPHSYARLQKRLKILAQKTSFETAEYLEKIVFPYSNNKPCRKDLFESYCDMKYENLTVRNLKGYDEYLKSVFGDYMQLPPEEQRIAHHGFVAYWK